MHQICPEEGRRDLIVHMKKINLSPFLQGGSRAFLFLLFFIGVAFASGQEAEEPSFSQSRAERGAARYVLDNGLTIILKENHTSNVASLQAWVKAGSTSEGRFSGAGISHFIEHMLFKGTKTRGVGQIGCEVKALGGETNGYTSFDHTVFLINLPGHNITKGIEILSDALQNSVLDPHEMEKEREVILKEIKLGRDSPERYLTRIAFETAYRIHPYRYPVIGYEALFKTLSRDDLLEYYRTMYVPNNIVLVGVGDFASEEVLSSIKEEFSPWKRKPIPPVWKLRPQEPAQLSSRSRIEEYPVKLTKVLLLFPGPNLNSSGLYSIDALAVILGEGKTSRLWRGLREEKRLVYSIDAFSYTPRDRGIFGIEFSLELENIEEANRAIFKEIDRIKKEGVSEEELTSAYKRVKMGYLSRLETVEGEASCLGSDEVTANSLNFSQDYVERIGQVTNDDIGRVARKYLSPEKMNKVALVPLKEKETKPLSRAEKESPSIEKRVLQNGITLLVRVDPHIASVSVNSLFLGGVRTENEETNGITQLLVTVMQKGTISKSSDDIAFAIEGRGGHLGGYAGYNSFGFSLKMPAEDIGVGLEVLADIIRNPSFPPEEIEREKMNQLAGIRSTEDSIFSVADRHFRRIMFAPHPYQFKAIGLKEVVKKITRDGLVEFYKEKISPEGMVLSISGDIDKDKLDGLVERLFGKWQKTKGKIISPSPPLFPPQVRIGAERFEKKEETVLLLGFPGMSIYDEDLPSFYMLEAILNSIGGRLFKVMRDELGLAYMVGSYHISGVDPGAFVFYITTVSERKEEALNALKGQILLLAKEPIPEDEIQQAKVELIGNHAFRLQTNSQIALCAGLNELYDLGYNYHTKYRERINGVTAERLHAVARKYLDLSRYTLISVGPDEKP